MHCVQVVPILRAGLILLESAATVLPASETYHVGYSRDDSTLEPRCYLNKLPPSFSDTDRVLIADPMLATGEGLGGGDWHLCAEQLGLVQVASTGLYFHPLTPVL